MPSGGKRPGAGAPKGNRNALRHGGSSQYVQQELLPALAHFPELQRWFVRYQQRHMKTGLDTRVNTAQVLEILIAVLHLPSGHPLASTLESLNSTLENDRNPPSPPALKKAFFLQNNQSRHKL